MATQRIDTCLQIESFSNSIMDHALQLRFEMLEECANTQMDQQQWLLEVIDECQTKGDYLGIASAAALLDELDIRRY